MVWDIHSMHTSRKSFIFNFIAERWVYFDWCHTFGWGSEVSHRTPVLIACVHCVALCCVSCVECRAAAGGGAALSEAGAAGGGALWQPRHAQSNHSTAFCQRSSVGQSQQLRAQWQWVLCQYWGAARQQWGRG